MTGARPRPCAAIGLLRSAASCTGIPTNGLPQALVRVTAARSERGEWNKRYPEPIRAQARQEIGAPAGPRPARRQREVAKRTGAAVAVLSAWRAAFRRRSLADSKQVQPLQSLPLSGFASVSQGGSVAEGLDSAQLKPISTFGMEGEQPT